MPSAEIIAIGTELLLGEITDTNTRDIALFLKDNGIDLFRVTIVGDNVSRIASAIQESLDRTDIIITSGGLGPTVDDPTRDAVALATNNKSVYMPELWEQIQDRFKRFGRIATENNIKQAFIPQNAVPIENNVGTAPAFYVEVKGKVIISLPGVPRELQHLLHNKVKPILYSKFELNALIKTRILRVAGAGESQVDSWIADLEMNDNPTVGLSAHPGQIDIRITAKAENEKSADILIEKLEKEIRSRLGLHIFGVDNETLEDKIYQILLEKNLTLAFIISGFSENFKNRILNSKLSAAQIVENTKKGTSHRNLLSKMVSSPADVIYAMTLIEGKETQELILGLFSTKTSVQEKRTYGGPPLLKEDWAVNQAFDFLRRNI